MNKLFQNLEQKIMKIMICHEYVLPELDCLIQAPMSIPARIPFQNGNIFSR
jgi:hypothetical protein